MQEMINEPIEVIASFGQSKVMPRLFRWRGRTYRPTRLGLVHRTQEGNATLVHYGVSDDANGYELVFDTLTLQWRLRTIHGD